MTAPSASLARRSLGVGVWNLASRLTGLGRVVVMTGALGATHLGDTFQSANLVSNVVFELVAGGVLSVALVPAFVRLIDAGDDAGVDRLAGRMLGLALAVTGVVTVVAMVAARPITEMLTVAVDDPEVRAERIELGITLLRWFLPQLVFYAAGAVATALLHAHRRFAAAAFAPVANNVVVSTVFIAFWVRRSGAPSLTLDTVDVVLLGAGTTAGVVAMTLVPWLALGRGVPRPALPTRHDAQLRALVVDGVWAAGHLGINQAMVAATLVVANGVEGGAVAYQVAFTCFLLPHALLANPIFTTTFPEMATASATTGVGGLAQRVTAAAHATAALLVPAAALGGAAAAAAFAAVVGLGAFDATGAALVALTLSAYLVGLVGYSTMFLAVRAAFAGDRARLAAQTNAVALAVLVVGLAATAVTTDGAATMAGVGLAHSVAVSIGAWLLVRGVVGRDRIRGLVAPWLRLGVVGLAAAVIGRVAGDAVEMSGTIGDVAAAAVAVVAAAVVLAAGAVATGRRDVAAIGEALR